MDSNPLKVLVISSCSGEKRFMPDNLATARDLDKIESRIKKEEELSSYRTTAKQMFISSQNIRINEAFNLLKNNPNQVDLAFISSAYGYIKENDSVVPYDINFSAMPMSDLDDRSTFLRIHEETYYDAKKYDLIFFLLGYEYLRSLKLPLEIPYTTKQIFFISPSDEKVLPENLRDIYIFQTGNDEAAKYGVKPSEFKGYAFKLICSQSPKEDVFRKIYEDPFYIDKILTESKLEEEKKAEQLNLFDI